MKRTPLLQRVSSPLQAVGSPTKLQRLGSASSDMPSYATLQRVSSPKQSPSRLAKSYRWASVSPAGGRLIQKGLKVGTSNWNDADSKSLRLSFEICKFKLDK